MQNTAPDCQELYLNRELSQLEFNARVLEQARDESIPILERLRYLCISSSNLDEFFEIRVAGLKEQEISLSSFGQGTKGVSPALQLSAIAQRAHTLVEDQYSLYNQSVLPSMEEKKIFFLDKDKWNLTQRKWIRNYFHRELLPVLSPVSLDPSHPFPKVLNKNLCFAVNLDGIDAYGRQGNIAILQAPRALPRIVKIPNTSRKEREDFVFLSSIIDAYITAIFPGMSVVGLYQFRVTRNSDLFLDDEAIGNLRQAVEGELMQRRLGNAVRLEISSDCPSDISKLLQREFNLDEDDVYRCDGPVNLMRLNQLPNMIENNSFKFEEFKPSTNKNLRVGQNIFESINRNDILLHHPFESFFPVVDFLAQAANDPNVIAIKQTLYRTGPDSPIVDALIKAAQNGKEVTVAIELKARFDEQDNIALAGRLQDSGAIVVYGVVGHKTHAKMILVVRREGKRLRRYVHIGTGNYHPVTSNLYTDFGLLTCSPTIGNDVQRMFQQITSPGRELKLKKLLQAPFTLHSRIIRFINHEIKNAKAGRPARIIAKMNALTEKKIVDKLYSASQAGVKIELIIRSACTLKPGIKGLSENITVKSIVDRFLEHTRIYYFENNGIPKTYIASADWMDRNFFSRVEIAVPIEDKTLSRRIISEGLRYYLDDNTNAWILRSSGKYCRIASRKKRKYGAQKRLINELSHF
tara:strand:- start:6551 stop:8626 length:2076 start_codon:yes stop_codon:yes gene_type:complete